MIPPTPIRPSSKREIGSIATPRQGSAARHRRVIELIVRPAAKRSQAHTTIMKVRYSPFCFAVVALLGIYFGAGCVGKHNLPNSWGPPYNGPNAARSSEAPSPNTVQAQWRRINGDGFSIEAPPGIRHVRHQGIDSIVGEFRGRNIRISYDFGWYGGHLKGWRADVQEVVIDGRRAKLGLDVPRVKGWGLKRYPLQTAISVRDDPDPHTTLDATAICATAEDCALARRMFASIRFHPPLKSATAPWLFGQFLGSLPVE